MTNKQIKLKIGGIHCAGCAQTIEQKLSSLGLNDPIVDIMASSASFNLPARLTEEQVKTEIRSLGYDILEEDLNRAQSRAIALSLRTKCLIASPLTLFLLSHKISSYWLFHNENIQLILATIVFALGLHQFGRSALGSIKNKAPNMDVLILSGASAAYIYSLTGTIFNLGHDYLFYETTASIITLVLIGNLMEQIAVKRTTTALEELNKLQPPKAKLVTKNHDIEYVEEVNAEDVPINSLVRVNTGDGIPVDGKVVSGEASVDESIITGETLPVEKLPGSAVFSGSIVQSGTLLFKVTAVGEESLLSNIVKLVKDAQSKKPQIQRIGDRVASYFVPSVIISSVFVLLVSWLAFHIPFTTSLLRSIAVLVIACPCAVGLATPTAILVGLGRAAKHGILVKGADTVEKFARIESIGFDKTGTLTDGNFKIQKIDYFSDDKDYINSIIKSIESHSSHPIARSLVKEFVDFKSITFTEVSETRGIGVKAVLGEQKLEIGTPTIYKGNHNVGDYDIVLLRDSMLLCGIELSDSLKTGTRTVIDSLHARGLKTLLISGDKTSKAKAVANEAGITEVYAEQNPNQKLIAIQSKPNFAFVGDGINDAPSISGATVGISLSNATGSAISSAQIILLNGELSRLVEAYDISKATYKVIKQNLFWAFFYNVIAIPVAAFGYLSPIIAAFSMAFSDLIVIGNSLRLRKRKI